MALGKYSRVDARKSSSGYCSTVTIVVFIALCLTGVWMMTSSSVAPGETTDVSQENKSEERTPATEISAKNNNDATSTDNVPNDDAKQKQFEVNPGYLPEDATKGDSNASQVEKNDVPEETDKTTEEKPEEKSVDEKKDGGEEKGDGSKDDEKIKVQVNQDSEAGETKESKLDNEKAEEDSGKTDGQTEEKADKVNSTEKKEKSNDVLPSGAQSDLTDESTTQNGSFSTQAAESKNEKEAQKSSGSQDPSKYSWKVCNTTAGPDYIPCLDNLQAVKKLRTTGHYEHRERHCPENPPTCLVPLPEKYQRSIEWPKSREKVQHFVEIVLCI